MKALKGKIAGWLEIDPKYLNDIEQIRQELSNPQKERKRKLKSFHVVCGYNNDDFIQARKTVIIYYMLAGQTKRRAFTLSFPEIYLNDTKTLRESIYTKFKQALNIRHT